MYVDKSIPIPENTPRQFIEEIKEMDSLFDKAMQGDEDAECRYMLLEDAFEATMKQLWIDGYLSDRDLDTLFKRFGWMV